MQDLADYIDEHEESLDRLFSRVTTDAIESLCDLVCGDDDEDCGGLTR